MFLFNFSFAFIFAILWRALENNDTIPGLVFYVVVFSVRLNSTKSVVRQVGTCVFFEKVSISKWSIPTEHWIATEYFVFCSSTVVYERQLYYSLIFIACYSTTMSEKRLLYVGRKKGYIRRAFFHNRNPSLPLSHTHYFARCCLYYVSKRFGFIMVVFPSESYSWICYQSLRNSLLTYSIFNKKQPIKEFQSKAN